MNKLLTSRRLWTFILAQVLTIGTFIFAHYNPEPFAAQLAVMVVGFIEGLAALLITALTVDDVTSNVTAIRMASHPDFAPRRIDQSGADAEIP